MPNFYSFGVSCQPAYQIRRATGQSISYFFDWLITPIDALEYVLLNFDAARFLGRTECCDDGQRILDNESGLKFQHDFPSTSGHIDAGRVTALLPATRKKYLRRRERLLSMLHHSPAVLIRYEWAGPDFCMTEVQTMHQFRSACRAVSPLKHLHVLASEHVSRTRFVADCLYFRLQEFSGEADDRWKGDDKSWDALFEMASGRLSSNGRNDSLSIV